MTTNTYRLSYSELWPILDPRKAIGSLLASFKIGSTLCIAQCAVVHTISTLCITLCSCAHYIHIVHRIVHTTSTLCITLCTLHPHCAHYVDIVHRRSTKCSKCVHLACDCFSSLQNKTLMLIDLNQESTNQVDLRVTFCSRKVCSHFFEGLKKVFYYYFTWEGATSSANQCNRGCTFPRIILLTIISIIVIALHCRCNFYHCHCQKHKIKMPTCYAMPPPFFPDE